MLTYSKDITNHFFDFIEGNITLQEFLTWANNTGELLDVLGIDRYTELLSVEFSGIFAADDLSILINSFYRNSNIGMNNEKIIWILESIIDGTYDSVKGCAILARMRSFEKEFEFLPIEFVGYDSVIEDLGYHYKEDEDKAEVERVTDLYRKEIVKTAKKFLDKVYKEPYILGVR